jgi:transposase-like protein
MAQRTAHRRHQAINQYLAADKVEDICQQLACSKSWLYKWRERYDANNPAWVQERSKRPQHPPTPTPEHVARAIVSLHVTLRHHGRGGSATAIMQALTQQGIAPVPSRRTMYRILCRHHREVKSRGARSARRVCPVVTGRLDHTADVVNAYRVLLLTRACTLTGERLTFLLSLPRTVRGHRYVSRSQNPDRWVSALVMGVTSAPP